jgi:1,4-dihydroxy-2-naphthoyl-CoA hydrolase
MTWTHTQTIGLRHTDAAGLLFAPRLLEMAQDAFEALQAHVSISVVDRLKSGGAILPTVHCEADFLKPISLGDQIQIEVRLAKSGDRSFGLSYTFLSSEGEIMARAGTVHVAMNPGSGRSVALTDEMKRIFQPLDAETP